MSADATILAIFFTPFVVFLFVIPFLFLVFDELKDIFGQTRRIRRRR